MPKSEAESKSKTSEQIIWEHLQKREFAQAASIIYTDLKDLYEKDFKVNVIDKIDEKLKKPIQAAADIFKNISDKAGELEESTISALKDFGSSCKRFGNRILSALGNVCQGFAEVAKNPGNALANVGEIFIKSLQTIRDFVQGKDVATQVGR